MRKALLIVAGAVVGLSFGGGEQAVSTFTDKRDGKVYRIVQIGRQVWFAENLNYAAKGSKCYENSPDSCAKYGRLYDWNTAMTACPAGTHLSTAEEWTALVDYAGGEKKAGKKLKSTSGWNEDGNGTDDYGFLALPGGGGNSRGRFDNDGYLGYWWNATEYNANFACYLDISYVVGQVRMYYDGYKTFLFSVRCVADKEGEQ